MSVLLLCILLITSIGVLAWSFIRPPRFLQYPAIASLGFLLFILPQAVGSYLENRSQIAALGAIPGFNETLLMAILSLGAIVFGNKINLLSYPERGMKQLHIPPIRLYRLFGAGIIYFFIAITGFFNLVDLTGGVIAYYSVEGSYGLEWSGLPVVYNFFLKLIFPAFFILYFCSLRMPKNKFFWLFTLLAALIPLADIVFLGRRTHTTYFVLLIILANYFARGRIFKRRQAILLGVLGFLIITSMTEYRRYSQIGGDAEKILQINVLKNIRDQGAPEFDVGRKIIYAYDQNMEFEYGALFYNKMIKDYVPTAIFSRDFKENLFLKTTDVNELTLKTSGWLRSSVQYIAPTGIAELFQQFWYFGAFIYFFVALFFGRIWHKAQSGDLSAIVFYAALSPYFIISITNDFGVLISHMVYFTGFFLPAYLILRKDIIGVKKAAV